LLAGRYRRYRNQLAGFSFIWLLIIRNGYLITEAYFYPYPKDFKHVINSCTKSVTSALVGIALREGCIKSLDEKVLPYFSDRKIKAVDTRKEALTVRHLLTMSTGLDWVENGAYGSATDSWTQMWGSENQIQYILDRPMRSDPGKDFYYCTGASHLLSGVLQKVTGKTAFEYGQQKLFEPLGIKDIYWGADGEGVNVGGAQIYMTSADMAKFGYLYLKHGKWGSQQVVPESWIRESTQKQMDTPYGLAGRYGYGYQWWMNSFGGYSARGYGGQYIFVIPKFEMVVVFTSGLPGNDFFLPELLMETFIVKAVQSSGRIKPNANGAKKLTNLIKVVGQEPSAKPIPKMPEMAARISGKKYIMEDSSSFSLVFKDGKECWLMNQFDNGPKYEIPVGLDDVFRIGDIGDAGPLPEHNWVACKGVWMNEQTFVITSRDLADTDELQRYLTFTVD
jgi:CubicO group peptidase (beta-lactamase class C family)